ncbi:hypothetical protein [Streptomyces collinus]|uniref:hypothetical protein n=1 Tax=Streptomyces collinus TaxID=42684 RepID=UPI0029427DF3|nr:hypothetical protein [Streptomyces collinus]
MTRLDGDRIDLVEVHDSMLDEIESTPVEVKVGPAQDAARRVRADFHPAADEEAPQQAEDDSVVVSEHTYPGKGSGSRGPAQAADRGYGAPLFEVGPWRFVSAQINREAGALAAGPATFQRGGRRFARWRRPPRRGGQAESVIYQPHEVRRLRKTVKSVRAVALGGTVTDVAGDDHHVEVVGLPAATRQ